MRSIYIFSVAALSLLSLSCNTNSDTNTEQHSSMAAGAKSAGYTSNVEIEQKWELPSVLKEVSGISYLSPDLFACVQDEDGIIFIYNTASSEIEKEISFAKGGDYEGLAMAGENAYIVRSDGTVFEVVNWKGEKPETSEYATHLTEDHNVEGLCYDKENNRLLLAIKGSEEGNKNYKGIYAFDLTGKKLQKEPIYKIDLTHAAFAISDEKDQQKIIRPSEINIHPQTGKIYITDAKDPKILIMDSAGKIEAIHPLNKDDFAQAEGLTFSPEGELFISNEGKKGSANILKVKLEGL